MFVSLDTFHQKLTEPGPLTVVSKAVVWLCVIAPLRAASTPSMVMLVWPSHAGEPVVSHVRFVASSASGSGPAGVTPSVAVLLTRLPPALPTMTE